MATKKRREKTARKAKARTPKKRGSRGGNKSEFIRSLPPDMPAKEVVAKGEEQGLKFTVHYVYALRSRATAESKGAPPRARGGRRAGAKGDGPVAKLRAVIAEIGLTRAREVLAEVEAAFGGP